MSETDNDKLPVDYLGQYKNLLVGNRLPNLRKKWDPLIPCRKDRYLTPEQLKQLVAKSPRIIKILDEMSKNDKNKKKELTVIVRQMLDEIGLARSLPVIRWLGICIQSTIKKICTGVYVNELSIEKVKKKIGTHPVLYLPSHRSYADFILMSYLCFTYDLEIPGIAAGMDFHGMVGMGNLLRKTGAFFMRRSFASDKLYWNVFKEYMHALVTAYHTGIEFFIEGTRSRSCKALPPKIGLLSMALEPLFMGEVPDITIVPVSISYDRPLEEQLFVYELLGVPKPKESTMGLIKSVLTIEDRYGCMYFDFGDPISVKEYFGDSLNRFQHALEPAHVQNLTKNELALIYDLAHDVVNCQQRRIVINCFNLIAICYCYRMYMGKMTTFNELCEGVLILSGLLRRQGAVVAVDPSRIRDGVRESLRIHCNILTIGKDERIVLEKPRISLREVNRLKFKAHALTEDTMKNTVPIFYLQIYINPCLFWCSSVGITILSAQYLTKKGSRKTSSAALRQNVEKLRLIFANEFVFYSVNDEKDFAKDVQLLKNYNVLSNEDAQGQISYQPSNIDGYYLTPIAPFLCCYLQVTQAIDTKFTGKTFNEKELLTKTQEYIEEALMSHKIFTHPYCLSLDSLSIALSSLSNLGCINKTKNNDLTVYTANTESIRETHLLLLDYCQLLPFNYLMDYMVSSKL
ncbi:dihydroxyacetone phosphate acyltransferase isoform X2 [Phlebotomus papatasi]|uniref:dihydroxyacetone phosphate acyltransferase isoform X2 n=1 Tax=Phlebotomus papatasi TaxID=29031 RepID=UPI002483A513|nr:dihydroxyacetone phosphate acyltransferase isoform X2 [Phlebotomus papatasi]XP_055698372.1 dihydroxyacetone phosphate acyltransferase isoform X2 [Phlebotomus papatasi]XP_055698373.1 dihydroxyacetone phosphate acyltransferase isoform X2 [Phlebotomus papatasi]